MLGLIGDFQGWVENVFIDQNTDNVNYLDLEVKNSKVMMTHWSFFNY